MASAWIYQRPEQVVKLGAAAAPWYVGWYEPSGRKRGKKIAAGFTGKKAAERRRDQLLGELATGGYEADGRVPWADFRREYEERVLQGLAPRSRQTVRDSLDSFERLCRPGRLAGVTARCLSEFVARRRQEAGKKKGSLVSPATVNKDLRHLRAALAVAAEWDYLPRAPRVRLEREPGKLPTFVSPEHFAALYAACEQARKPKDFAPGAAAWWRALLVVAYLTGWRIGDLLGLRREDVDLETGSALLRSGSEGNKGKRDERLTLHPVAVEHLRAVRHFGRFVFPWAPAHHRRTLDDEFHRLQRAAGIHLPCRGEHEHTPACHCYGFHDLRRAFATMNADRLTADALQALMRHKSYQTTQRYINLAKQLEQGVADLHVPEILQRKPAP